MKFKKKNFERKQKEKKRSFKRVMQQYDACSSCIKNLSHKQNKMVTLSVEDLGRVRGDLENAQNFPFGFSKLNINFTYPPK